MNKKFDYIVIGSGAAGSVVAARLSEDPGTTVLVLEAGVTDASVLVQMPGALAYPLLDKLRTWRFETGPEASLNGRTITHVRGRMTGGSSSLNGMVYVRGNPRDYDAWAAEGLTEWSYAHCLPYFKKLEKYDKGPDAYRGGSGPVAITTMRADKPIFQAFLQAAQQAGHVLNHDYNAYRQEGVHVHQANIDRGRRASAARAYLLPAMARAPIELRLRSLVTRIRFSESKRAVGVEYFCKGEMHTVEAEREVILCGGAYNSPQLLMLSGVGDPKHLSQHGIPLVSNVPGVGRSLEDHVAAPLSYRASRTGVSPGVGMNVAVKAAVGARWLFGRSGLGASNLWETGMFFKSGSDVDYADLQHEFLPVRGDYALGDVRAEEGFTYSTSVMRPKSRGYVDLKSPDPRVHPRIVNNYLNDLEDRRALIAGVKHTDEIVQQAGWDGIRGAAVSPPLRKMSDHDVLEWLKTVSGTQYHPACTCRMGVDGASVVDSQGRVRGVHGLRVVDASIMPHVTSGNLHCPTLMIAEKLSDAIRGISLEPQIAPYADSL